MKRTTTMRLAIFAGILVASGLCQNAEPGRRFHDFRNSPAATDFESQRDDFWDVPPEGSQGSSERLETEEPSSSGTPSLSREAEVAAAGAGGVPVSPRGSGNENGALQPGKHTSKSFDPQRASDESGTRLATHDSSPMSRSDSRQLQSDRRRKKRRRIKHIWRDRPDLEERENLVNVGGRSRGKKKPQNEVTSLWGKSFANTRKARGRINNFREERRRRRRNRKRIRSRIRFESRREERKWENPIAILVKVLKAHGYYESKSLSANPLNLSTTGLDDDNGPTEIFDATNATSSSSYPSQLTTEPRIPEPPEPTFRYHVLPGEVEREFSRHVEREFSRAQLAEKSAADQQNNDEDEEDEEEEEEEDDDEMNGELPSFDERYLQTTKQPDDLAKASFDPERMLGYSRTDEDLPILDMENEVLQRTLKDYNAYMSSSIVRAAKTANNKEDEDSEGPRFDSNLSSSTISSTTESAEFLTDDDDPRGDLSCINGTFLPAPFVHHAVIKYVKSSSPGHEYLEADYNCEPGFAMSSNSSRLLCRNRRWIGRLPVCKYRGDDEATCTELGCEQLCKIINGRAECLCREGFRREGHKCIDIDECLANEGRGPCQDTCHNLAGGYYCSCEGRPGYQLAPNNRTCQEPSGGLCNYNNAGCSHTCLASMGRVFCLCPDGFMLEDDWKTCQDVDECAVPDLQTEVCRYGCINTPGSYRCAPPPPTPSRHTLELLQSGIRRNVECQTGYQVAAGRNCVDINECATNNGGCSEVCENTEGSYFCACEGDERILSSDRKTCVVAEERFESIDREASLSMHYRESSSVSCSHLNPAGRGYLICSDNVQLTTTTEDGLQQQQQQRRKDNDDEEDEEREPIRPGTKCHLKCPHGYELHGEYELTCRADGTWDGPKHGECLRYSKPRLDCPKDVVAELPPGRDEAFVTYEQPSTDLDWFRYVRSKPSWGTRLEANLKKGLHEITFYARHPVSKKQTSCTLKINVEEGQAPKVKGCPSDIEVTGKNGSTITWIEPVFTDNVKVTRLTSNESPGQTFSTGGHKIEYEAGDEAGWTTKCIFTVVLRPVVR